MLLEFKIKNYKTFREETVFSMVPKPGLKGLDYSILSCETGEKKHRALSSAVIYGPNAAGKTNMFGAADNLRHIVLMGHIRDGTACNISMMPFSEASVTEPVEFGLSFIAGGIKFDYNLAIDAGGFMEEDYRRSVSLEELHVNGGMIFRRTDTLEFGNLRKIKDYWIKGLDKNLSVMRTIAQNNLDPEELFLTNGFKSMFSSALAGLITEWFEKKLIIIHKTDRNTIGRYTGSPQHKEYIEKTLRGAAKTFGITANELEYVTPEDGSEPRLYSLPGSRSVNAESYESFGTLKFINEFPLVIAALTEGAVLIIDEFDTSIQPLAVMNIIGMFHNDDINKNNAQLIFNTHNPIFLNKNLFRRDEIKFVERDGLTHESTHYSLSDFGAEKAREDYIKNYFVSQYGAIRDIDFSPMFADEEPADREDDEDYEDFEDYEESEEFQDTEEIKETDDQPSDGGAT